MFLKCKADNFNICDHVQDQIFGELLKRRKSESSGGVRGYIPKEDGVKSAVDEEGHTVSYEHRKSDVIFYKYFLGFYN